MRTARVGIAIALGFLMTISLMTISGCGSPRREASGPAPTEVTTPPAASPIFSPAAGLLGRRDLYAGTPAEHFAVGAAAIVLPSNPVVPGATPTQVSTALDMVRKELIAAFLSDQLLVHHDPSAVLAPLVATNREETRASLVAGKEGTTFVQFVDGARLASPPRLAGSITVTMRTIDGVRQIDVLSNYVVTYAFVNADDLVIVRSQTHWLFPFAADAAPADVGMWYGSSEGFWSGMDCAATNRGLTGPAPLVDPQAKPSVVDTRSSDSYYDPNIPPDVGNDCL
jgi:hypothetical protein